MERDAAWTRRQILRTSAVATAAAFLPSGVFAQGTSRLKVGLIGAGGRGTGAAFDAAAADAGVVIWSVGDVFKDRLDGSVQALKDGLKDRCQVTPDRSFVGFDAYKGVIASGVDVVILTAPPGFRPAHLQASVEAGKHVFMEKPVATDVPGVKAILAAAQEAKSKRLSIVAGTQRRHDVAYREAMKRIHDGQMGDVTSCYAYWNQGGLWMNPRQPGWTDMEWQLRNWLYFTWLSGDIIVEQHIHNIDVCNWAMQKHPVKAVSLAGRQVRTDKAYGHVFDHFATEYEYDNGVKMISMCRQIDGTASRVSEHIVGTKGASDGNNRIRGENPWRWEGDRPNPYVEEHKHLYAAIRGGNPINEGQEVAHATMTAIMGRLAGYSGQEITWDDAMNLTEVLAPKQLAMGPIEVPPVAMPGQTRLA
jgi:predicted dehydrogenase